MSRPLIVQVWFVGLSVPSSTSFHVRADAQAFWAARIKLNGRTTAGERSFVHSSITGRNMRLVISKARRQMCWATMDV